MTEKTREFLLADPKTTEVPASIDLLKRFVQACKDGDPLKGRLKAIPRLVNPDEISDMSIMTRQLIYQYNAKPFLTGPKFHTFHHGKNYLECDVDLHRYCYPARKMISDMLPLLTPGIFDMGVVIEAHEDHEQPEQVLGAARFFNLDHSQLHTFEEVYKRPFSAPAPH